VVRKAIRVFAERALLKALERQKPWAVKVGLAAGEDFATENIKVSAELKHTGLADGITILTREEPAFLSNRQLDAMLEAIEARRAINERRDRLAGGSGHPLGDTETSV
jgi:hypothetical protein